MTDIEFRVYAVVFALCAGFLLLAGVYHAMRYSIPKVQPPAGKGLVSVEGFGLVDVAGVMFFFIWFVASFLGGRTAEEELELTPLFLVFALFVQGAMAAMVIAFLVWRVRLIELWGLRWSKWWLSVLAIPSVFVMWAFMAVLEQAGYNAWIAEMVGGETTQEMVTALQEETNFLTLALVAVMAVVGAPLSEEIIFRGYIYPAFKRFAGIPCAVLFSAALFSVVHLNLAALLPLFLLGIGLAVLYEATGSLWMPIAVHGLFNLGTVVMQQLMRIRPELFEELQEKAGEAAMWWIG